MRDIEVKDTMFTARPTTLYFNDHAFDTQSIFWRATDHEGVIRENGFISLEDAERLAFWLHGVVDDYRARQAGDQR